MTPANDLEQKAIEEHLPFIKYIAVVLKNRLPPSVQLDDLIQWGSIGLLQALKGFDPSKNFRFKTYAELRVRGAMLDGLRDEDPLSRSVRDSQKKLADHALDFQNAHQRPPSASELSAAMEITIDELNALGVRTQAVTHLSIDEPEIFNSDDRKALLVSAQNKSASILGKIEAMQKLERMVAGKTPMQRACFILFFVWGFSQIEIAELFDVSASRISQIIKRVHFSNLQKWRDG